MHVFYCQSGAVVSMRLVSTVLQILFVSDSMVQNSESDDFCGADEKQYTMNKKDMTDDVGHVYKKAL